MENRNIWKLKLGKVVYKGFLVMVLKIEMVWMNSFAFDLIFVKRTFAEVEWCYYQHNEQLPTIQNADFCAEFELIDGIIVTS